MLEIDRRVILIFGLGVLGVGLLAGVITAIAVTLSQPEPMPVTVESRVPVVETYSAELADITVPNELAGEAIPQWYPLRPKIDRWTKEMAEPYWIPVENILTEYIENEQMESIERLLSQIP